MDLGIHKKESVILHSTMNNSVPLLYVTIH